MNYAVIGCNYGDEGKGLMTDYFASRSNYSTVVRFNGGAQAGHTVVTPEGKRHVFSHIGSGTFTGAFTSLSIDFIINPNLFLGEYHSLNLKEKIFTSKRSYVTTPYDMLINQLIENIRDKKHGSCGVGINETVCRNLDEDPNFHLTVNDLKDISIQKFMYHLKKYWIPKRLHTLNIDYNTIPDKYKEFINREIVIQRFVEEVEEFLSLTDSSLIVIPGSSIIFEGAQGLLLDETNGKFPYVTRSRTGVTNIIKRCYCLIPTIEFCFVTRCYMTRHGNGPFPTETYGKAYDKIIDETNIPNKFQGKLRFGYLNLDDLIQNVRREIDLLRDQKISMAITCLDQLDSNSMYCFLNKNYVELTAEKLMDTLKEYLGIKKFYLSYGPTRTTIQEINL